MGNLINPLSRILGFKKNLFWANNFSFYYLQEVYRQKIFKIKCFQRLFKFIFRRLFVMFDIPRVYYNLNLNFIGQANSIINIDCNVRNLHLYNMAGLVLLLQEAERPDIRPRIRNRYGIYKLKSKLQYAFKFVKARFEKVFQKWRKILFNLFLHRLKNKLQIKKSELVDDITKRKFKYQKMRLVLKYCKHFEINDEIKENLKYKYNLNTLKISLKGKFKILGAVLKMLRKMNNHFFADIFNILFRTFFKKINYDFGFRKIKLNFKRKKTTASAIVRNVNYFAYLALRRGYRINYVIKMIRYGIRFLKIVRGFHMVVSGRFYRRGRAMYKVSTLGEKGSHTGKGCLMYRNSERMKEYGMCSIKLIFFFRRKLRMTNKLPIRARWFHYLKFLRANYKIRHKFGFIRY